MQRNVRTQLDDNARQVAWDKDVFVYGSPGTDDLEDASTVPATGEYVTLSGPYTPGTLEITGTDGTVYVEGTDFYAVPEDGTWQNLTIPEGTQLLITYAPEESDLPYYSEEEIDAMLRGVTGAIYADPVIASGEVVSDASSAGDLVMVLTGESIPGGGGGGGTGVQSAGLDAGGLWFDSAGTVGGAGLDVSGLWVGG